MIDRYVKEQMDKGPSYEALAQSIYEHDFCDRHTYEQCQIMASIIGRAKHIDEGGKEDDWNFKDYLPVNESEE